LQGALTCAQVYPGLCLLLALFPVAARGQVIPGPAKNMPPEPVPVGTDDDHLFGSWGGVRTVI